LRVERTLKLEATDLAQLDIISSPLFSQMFRYISRLATILCRILEIESEEHDC
jgi:hypothetical protein